MGARLPPHGTAVRGRTQNFLAGFMAKNFVGCSSHPGQMEREGAVCPRKDSGKQVQGWRQEGRTARHQAQFPRTRCRQVCMGAQVTARQGGATGTVAASRVFTHRTVAAARNRASGFGGDWQVRQQLPVGVGPDDRMPPGSREPKWAQ